MFISSAHAADFTAKVDRTVITEDESLVLTLHINEQIGYGGPDLTLLEKDFDILNQHRSNQFRSLNGRTEAWTEWSIALVPKKTGKLLIPSFEFSNSYTDAIEITVNPLTTSNNETRELFATVETDKNTLFVQEQLLVTVRLHSAVDLREISVENDLIISDATVEHLSEISYRKNINGRLYNVAEIVYAVYPQQSGELTIPELSWNAMVVNRNWRSDPFRASRGTLRRIKSIPFTVSVESKPDAYSGNTWLPAKNVRLEQHWSGDPKRFIVGEPLTRRISIIADGLSAAQLPPFADSTIDKIKIYSDQPQLDEQKSNSGIVGSRHESLAIVPTEAGKITLPAIEVTWWNTLKGEQEVARLPEQVIEVSPIPLRSPMASNPPSAALSNDNGVQANNALATSDEESISDVATKSPMILWISNAVFAALALSFFIAWLNARKNQRRVGRTDTAYDSTPKNETQLFNDLRRACANNQAVLARNLICQWARYHWRLTQQPSINFIKAKYSDESLHRELELLDSLLYASNSSTQGDSEQQDLPHWNGTALWKALTAAKQEERKKHEHSCSSNDLPPLYPSSS